MLVRSTLVRMSPGSQNLRSAYCARSSPRAGRRIAHQLDERLFGPVAAQHPRRRSAIERQRAAAGVVTANARGIGLLAARGEREQRRLGAQRARRPVGLGIERAERAEHRPAQSGGQQPRAPAPRGAGTRGGDSRRTPRPRRRPTARRSRVRAPAGTPARSAAPRHRRRARRTSPASGSIAAKSSGRDDARLR